MPPNRSKARMQSIENGSTTNFFLSSFNLRALVRYPRTLLSLLFVNRNVFMSESFVGCWLLEWFFCFNIITIIICLLLLFGGGSANRFY